MRLPSSLLRLRNPRSSHFPFPFPFPFPLPCRTSTRAAAHLLSPSDLPFPGSPSLGSAVPCRGVRSLVSSPPSPSSSSPMMGGVAAEDGMASRFWVKFRSDSVFAFFTPFVVCLAAGNLELDVFRRYIAQDVHFLKVFSRAYEMAEEWADDDDDKASLCELRKSVDEELKMHDSVVQGWGIDPVKETIPDSATLKYTDFLLATASGKIEGGKGLMKIATPFEKTKIAAYAVGAMTPCMRLYASLAKELDGIVNPAEGSHLYKKWIDNYSSEGFQASARQIEDLLDKLSISLTGEELEVIERLYQQAIRLEVNFFLSQPVLQQSVVPFSRAHDSPLNHLVIFSDFDLTCTVVDSSAILAEIAILAASKAEHVASQDLISRKSSEDLRNLWDVLSHHYADEHEQCIGGILTPEQGEGFNYEGLCNALEQLSDFEKRANSRVIDSGVLKGLNIDDIKRAGERLILQDGCVGFFQQLVRRKEELSMEIHVLSYCWCADLIRSSLSAGGSDFLNIHSNEFVYEGSVSTGEISWKVESPLDKLQAFREAINKCSARGKHSSVYIGDSVGDLLCLLEADVGIVIGSSSSLRQVGKHFGVSFVPLLCGVVKKQKELVEGGTPWRGLSGTLYTVSGWAEIRAFILGSSQ